MPGETSCISDDRGPASMRKHFDSDTWLLDTYETPHVDGGVHR